jgi:hypothetical protein
VWISWRSVKAAIGQPAWPRLALAPDFSPTEYPMTRAQLAPLGVSPPFIEDLTQFGRRSLVGAAPNG